MLLVIDDIFIILSLYPRMDATVDLACHYICEPRSLIKPLEIVASQFTSHSPQTYRHEVL
jgi:hypothetical protein